MTHSFNRKITQDILCFCHPKTLRYFVLFETVYVILIAFARQKKGVDRQE